MSCSAGTALCHATGQISVSLHTDTINHKQLHKFQSHLFLDAHQAQIFRFPVGAGLLHLFPLPNLDVPTDVQRANVSPARNYPWCPYAVWEE